MNYKSFEYIITSQNEKQKEEFLTYTKEIEKIEGILAVQLFNHQNVISQSHIESAIWHAVQGYIRKNMISKQLSLEILLFLSAQRQIKKAYQKLGISSTNSKVGLIIICENNEKEIEIIKNSTKQIFNKFNLGISKFEPQIDQRNLHNLLKTFEISFKDKLLDENKVEELILSKIALLRINN